MRSGLQTHYAPQGDIARRILAKLAERGVARDVVTTAHLAPFDEFHIGGREATLAVAAGLHVDRGDRVLDLGAGLGGPARTLAEVIGCRVEGIDLTAAFCAAGNEMSAWLGLGDLVALSEGDVTDYSRAGMPFDAAMSIHVGMNVADKPDFYACAHAALRPGGRFVLYDLMQGEAGAVHFPVPWATEPSFSHLSRPDEVARAVEGAGFHIIDRVESTGAALAWFRARVSAAAADPDYSFRLFLGDRFGDMAANVVRNLDEGRLRAVRLVCRRPK